MYWGSSIDGELTGQSNLSSRNKGIDNSDMPWNRRADKAINTSVLAMQDQTTQADSVRLSQDKVEKMLSELLGISVIIVPSASKL